MTCPRRRRNDWRETCPAACRRCGSSWMTRCTSATASFISAPGGITSSWSAPIECGFAGRCGSGFSRRSIMQSHALITEHVKTKQRSEIVDVTDSLRRLVRQHHLRDGLAICYVPHTTAAVTINENYDPDVKHDMLKKLD